MSMLRFAFLIPFLILFALPAFAQNTADIDLEKCKPDDAKCISDLGFLFESGNFEHEKDIIKAAILYRRAADIGDSGAMLMLGILYSQGRGVEKNPDEALKWWKKSAEAGHPNSAFYLGDIYSGVSRRQVEVKQDYVEALKWYRMGGENGNTYSSTRAAEIYEQGLGVKQDYPEAAKWYLRAANDSDEAAYKLGLLYLQGLGVPQNDATAAKFFHRAADNWGRFDEPRIELAKLYAQGKGVEQNYAEALYWFKVGAGDKNKNYSELNTEILAHLSAEQIAAVEARVKKWQDDAMASIFDHPH